MCLGLDTNVCEQHGSCPHFLAFGLFLYTMWAFGRGKTAGGVDRVDFQAHNECITGNIEVDIC